MTLVEARGLSKRFGRFQAVDNVSFAVARGEVTGFLGPNGAGKSTTMKMLTGFLPPDAGAAYIDSQNVAEHPVAARTRVGYLPEGAPAYADMTVAEFLGFIGRMRGLARGPARERIAEMVEQVHLAPVWNRRIENLSKGYARRVGIAQALLHDPDVLILDEPTDGLDPNQKHEMRALIRAIAPQKAIIISTHLLEEVEAVCSRAIIIANGRLVADQTPSAFVATDAGVTRLHLLLPSTQLARATGILQARAGALRVQVIGEVGASSRLLVEYRDRALTPAVVLGELDAVGIGVEEIGHHRPSLEDVFRRITGAGSAGAGETTDATGIRSGVVA